MLGKDSGQKRIKVVTLPKYLAASEDVLTYTVKSLWWKSHKTEIFRIEELFRQLLMIAELTGQFGRLNYSSCVQQNSDYNNI